MRLDGIVEIDETFILESFKGRRSDLPRTARKRGGPSFTEFNRHSVIFKYQNTIAYLKENSHLDEQFSRFGQAAIVYR